jgi:hypothetical protein
MYFDSTLFALDTQKNRRNKMKKYDYVEIFKKGNEETQTKDVRYRYDWEKYQERLNYHSSNAEFKSLLTEEKLQRFIHVLFNKIELGNVDIARAIMLATFMDKSNVVMYGKKPMLKEDIDEILDISPSERNKLLKRLEENSIVFIHKNRIEFNIEYFVNGRCNSTNYSRMFSTTIQELYYFCDKSSLAIVYKVLPLLSFNHNILCHNPSAKKNTVPIPITWHEFAEIIGWTSISKFKSKMSQYTLINEEPIFLTGTIGSTEVIYVNRKRSIKARILSGIEL